MQKRRNQKKTTISRRRYKINTFCTLSTDKPCLSILAETSVCVLALRNDNRQFNNKTVETFQPIRSRIHETVKRTLPFANGHSSKLHKKNQFVPHRKRSPGPLERRRLGI